MTMAMIAFVPSEQEVQHIALDSDGSLPAEELHVTVMFLGGDEDDIPQETFDRARQVAESMADKFAPFEARVAGAATLGDEDPPANVMLMNSADMDEIKAAVWDEMDGAEFREQYRPWIPHMTLAYGYAEVPNLNTVRFDRIRVAVDDQVTDFELSGEPAATMKDKEGDRMSAPTRFRMMLAPLDAPTGDRRRFQSGGITHAPLPIPVEWAREKGIGHDGSVAVGRITDMEIGDSEIWSIWELFDDVDPEEMPRLAEDVAEVKRLIEGGAIGPSVDLDSFEGFPVKEGTDEPIDFDEEFPEEEPDLLVTEGRIRAATLVTIPAFVETAGPIELLEGEESKALVAAVIGSTDLPIADRDTEWDGQAAMDRVFDLCTDGDTVDVECVSRAFLWRDPDPDPETRGAYSLGFADVVNGELQIVPQGIAATTGGRGVDETDIPEEDKADIRTRICSVYDTVRDQIEDWPECPFEREESSTEDDEDAQARVASVTAPVRPKVADLDYPSVLAQGLTPITYDYEGGKAYGHIAPRKACHERFRDRCRTPPMNGDYSQFHRYPLETEDGGTVWVGRITAGGLHVQEDDRPITATVQGYDEKKTVAHVRAGEDEHGIWISGVLTPEAYATETQSITNRRKVSADWRGTEAGLRMIEVLALPPGPRSISEPGYPIKVHESRGLTRAMTACLGPFSDESDPKQVAMAEEFVKGVVEKEVSRVLAGREAKAEAESELSQAVAEFDAQQREELRAELEKETV